MSNLPLTEWYPATIKPKRTGFYEVERFRHDGTLYDRRMAFWGKNGYGNGYGWLIGMILVQDFWRGVAIDPEAK